MANFKVYNPYYVGQTQGKSTIKVPTVVGADVKQKDIELWKQWKRTQSEQDLNALLKQMDRIIKQQTARQRGSLPDFYLEIEAKKYAIEAFRTYNPNQGVALSTHLVNNLKQLSRVNMTYQSAVRAPEHQQRQIGEFQTAKSYLKEELGRAPTTEELSEHLKLNHKMIHRLEQSSRTEWSESRELPTDISHTFSGPSDVLDPRITYIYSELTPQEKLIFEHTTGYGGKPILTNQEIAKKLGISYTQFSYQKRLLTKKIQDKLDL